MKRSVTSQGFLTTLTILFGGMISSQFTLIGVFIYLVTSGDMHPDAGMLLPMLYLVPAVACICFGLSFVLPAKWIANAAEKPTLGEKLRGFQTATIIRLAMLEAPSVLGCVGFYMTGEYYFLAANAVSLGLFAISFPSRVKIIDGLRLPSPEADLLNNPSAVVMEYEVTSSD